MQEIRRLADICEQHDGIQLKLNWEMLKNRSLDQTNDFFCYQGSHQDGRLIGYLALYGFGSREIELNGMIHPAFRRKTRGKGFYGLRGRMRVHLWPVRPARVSGAWSWQDHLAGSHQGHPKQNRPSGSLNSHQLNDLER
ncbi:MAG: hypothetical protein M1379_17795 [Firmicutes bacterium]|nr:hypothetical protein [Bacillota bacterium]